jgi:hypothetical protein
MTNSKRILFIIGILAILVVLMVLLWRTPQRHSWLETYKEDSRDPFGTQVIFELLKSYFPGQTTKVIEDKLSEELPEKSSRPSNYVFIGEGLYLDSLDTETLLNYVSEGNTAFISSRTIPYDLMYYLYDEECISYYWDDYYSAIDTSQNLNFSHPDLRSANGFDYTFIFRNKTRPYRWQYIDSSYFCNEEYGFVELGRMNDTLINFARIKHGGGAFYLHTTPVVFSNIQLLEKTALDYADRVFSHLEEGAIYWDKSSKVSEATARQLNNNPIPPSERRLSNETPLQYILSQPPLAGAWYTLLGAALLYLLFRAKRRQRIIPVMDQNANTSLEFVRTIGRLYFLQNNHRQLSLQKMKLFKAFVREKYQITLRNEQDEALIERLVNKSEVPEDIIKNILSMYRNIDSSSFVSENTLIDFHKRIDRFYKQCK